MPVGKDHLRHAMPEGALARVLLDGTCVLDDGGRIASASERFYEITGFSRAALLRATPTTRFWPPEHGDRLAALTGAVARAPVVEDEVSLVRRDGERFTAAVRAARLDDGAGVLLLVRDVTEEAAERARLREAHSVARLVTWEWDPATGRVALSDSAAELGGLPPEPAPTLAELVALFPAPHDQRVEAALDAVRAGRDGVVLESPVILPDPALRWVEVRMEPVRARDRAVVRVRGTAQDVTPRKEAERARRASEERLREAQRMAHIGSFEVDYRTDRITWSSELSRLFGVDPETFSQDLADVRAMLPPGDGLRLREAAQGTMRDGRPRELQHAYLRGAERRFGEMRLEPLSDGPTRYGVRGTLQDVTDRVLAQRRLRAAHDELRAITDSIGEGLCTVDVDGRLTYLNPAGEALLGYAQEDLLGRVMHDVVHPRDRHGAPLAVEDCPLRHARRDGQVVRLDDEVFVRSDGEELPVKITSAPLDTEEGPRGSVVVFSDISARKAEERRLAQAIERVTWAGRVREALDEDRLVLHAQPIVELATGRTVQHELLVRMREPGGGLIAPACFIPAAEEHGVIVDLDRWVVGQAVGLAARGHAVELNVSARSLGRSALVDALRDDLERTGADPALIVVEMTETALLADGAAADRFIECIKAFGCRLALDDFGTGYGGFTYLKRLPVDLLKLDVEFVSDLLTNAASRHVVSAVVSLARGFGQRTVAEGVEDLETAGLLRELGVDYAQGFAIARPAPVEDVLGG